MDELWTAADRSGRTEFRAYCPYCSKEKGGKTLSLNTRKRQGYCHRCELKISGNAPEHFAAKYVDDLELERNKRGFRFNQIKDTLKPITENDSAGQYLDHRLESRLPELPRMGFSPAIRYYSGPNSYKTTPASSPI